MSVFEESYFHCDVLIMSLLLSFQLYCDIIRQNVFFTVSVSQRAGNNPKTPSARNRKKCKERDKRHKGKIGFILARWTMIGSLGLRRAYRQLYPVS